MNESQGRRPASPQCAELWKTKAHGEKVNEKVPESKVRRDRKEIKYCTVALL